MKNSQKGSILVLVLLALVTLSLLAFSVGYTVQQKINTAIHFESRAQLRLAAEAAAKQAKLVVRDLIDSSVSYHSLLQGWSNDHGLWKSARLGRVTYDVKDDDHSAAHSRYGLIDENSKININLASKEILQSLIQSHGVDSEDARKIAAAITDFRDEDDDLTDGGAESQHYSSKKKPYHVKNAPFDTLEELLWVEGMNRSLYEKLGKNLTLYGEWVNLNTAPPVVLVSMGIDSYLVNAIDLYRRGVDGVLGTKDDGVFKLLGEAGASLVRAQLLNEAEGQNLDATLAKNFSVKSDFFKMNFSGGIEGQKQMLHAQVIFNQAGKVLKWSEEFYSQ